jgi:hypothetical protein
MKTKKIKDKTSDQLHEEIMQLFLGQEMSTTVVALIETLVSVTLYMEEDPLDILSLIVEEYRMYQKVKK